TASPLSSSAQSSNHSVPVSVFDQSPTTGGQTVLDNSSVVHNALPKPPMIAPTRLGCLAGHSTCQNALRAELSAHLPLAGASCSGSGYPVRRATSGWVGPPCPASTVSRGQHHVESLDSTNPGTGDRHC